MALPLLTGVGAGLAMLWVPVGLIEMVVASSGLSEALSAAAPPLGLKARLLLAGFAALMAAAIVASLHRDRKDVARGRQENGRIQSAQGARKMGFAFSKLTALARGRPLSAPGGDAPVLRRADAHPDAPARAPIFASRDFGGADIFARTEPGHRKLVVTPEPKYEPVVSAAGLAMPSAPAPLPDAVLPRPACARAASEPAFAAPTVAEPVAAPVVPVPAPVAALALSPSALSTSVLSISELTERLERGLVQRAHIATAPDAIRVIADMPVAAAVPVRATVLSDVDDALRAALGTLRTMAARAR